MQNNLSVLITIMIFTLILSSVKLTLAVQIESTISEKDVISKTGKLQIPFIANKGQTDKRVKFYTTVMGGTVFVTADGEIIYALQKQEAEKKNKNNNGRKKTNIPSVIFHNTVLETYGKNSFLKLCFLPCLLGEKEEYAPGPVICNTQTRYIAGEMTDKEKRIILKEIFIKRKPVSIQGEKRAITRVNYLKGKDPSKWLYKIPTYDVITLGEIYEGIEISLRISGNNIEKVFSVKPNADPDLIIIGIRGAKDLQINEEGLLEAITELGTVKFTKPVAYQEINGKRKHIAADYRIKNLEQRDRNSNEEFSNSEVLYGFSIASYDKTKELIIDPFLSSTFLGGSAKEFCRPIARAPDGNVYIAGYTSSADLPIPDDSDNFNTFHNGGIDAFVARLNDDLTNLSEITYLGGGGSDGIDAIFIDPDNNIYVTGFTESSDFPTTSNAYSTTQSGGRDAFVAVFNKHLTKLSASTYLGGTASDNGFVITKGTDGSVYITGTTSSIDFPVTIGAYNTTYGGNTDAFVAKLNKDLSNLSASTYLGESGLEFGFGIAREPDDNVYVCGYTLSSEFPTTSNVYDTSYNGNGDVFVALLSKDLTNLFASTYLGGNESDSPGSMIIDSKQNIYVAGITESSDFPTTSDAYEHSNNGHNDVFVAILNKDLNALSASTYLGGSDFEGASSIIIDSDEEKIYVAGGTFSGDFPITHGTYGGGRDTFITSMDRDLTTIHDSTYLGGSAIEGFSYLATDQEDNIYVAGETSSSDFPVTSEAYDTSYNGSGDAFVCILDLKVTTTPTPIPTLTDTPTPVPSPSEPPASTVISSTYLGGSGREFCRPITLDGNVYIAGFTESSDLPIPGYYNDNYDTSINGGRDAFVARLNKDLTSLSDITYLGGSGLDKIDSIIADSNNNNIYVTGTTNSTDFPTTSDAFDTTHNGRIDAFVSVLNKDLTILSASTYLGGASNDDGFFITDGSDDNIYVVGSTLSSDFPVTTNAYDTIHGGGSDAFITMFNKDLTGLSASTYLGGSGRDFGFGITKVPDGNIYVSGNTFSSDFPTTSGAYDTSYNGNGEVFVAMLSEDLANLSASTYLGGSGGDSPGSMILKSKQNSYVDIYVVGATLSPDFPTTGESYDTSYNSGGDAFAVLFNKDLTNLLASTFLGGSENEGASSIIIDSDEDKIYIAGQTSSGDFPTTHGTYGGNGDTFFTCMDRDLMYIHDSTYLGGSAREGFSYIDTDTEDNIYVAGETFSFNFPVTSGAYDTSYNGSGDAFVCKLDLNMIASPTPTLTVTPTPVPATSEPPTTVTLISFTAKSFVGEVMLEWVTATEIDNAGFNLYRTKRKNGKYKKINDALIKAEGEATSGASYSYIDILEQGGKYFYQLEDVDYYGHSTMHGPLKVRVK